MRYNPVVTVYYLQRWSDSDVTVYYLQRWSDRYVTVYYLQRWSDSSMPAYFHTGHLARLLPTKGRS
jgi:hypothetical protein